MSTVLNVSTSHGVQCFRALLAAATDRRLHRSDIACLGRILDHYNLAKGAAWPGLNLLAKKANVHRSNVILAIQRLEAHGYLMVERAGPGRSNRYRPTFKIGFDGATGSDSATSTDGATSSDSTTGAEDATSSVLGTQLVAPARLELVAPARPEHIQRTYPKNLPKKHTCAEPHDERFDEFWSAYPRKQGSKEKARKSWTRQKLDPSADQIIAAVTKRKQGDSVWQEPRFIPHPLTYINNQRWLDEWTSASKPSVAASFRDKTYVGTPDHQLAPEFRAAIAEAEAVAAAQGRS